MLWRLEDYLIGKKLANLAALIKLPAGECTVIISDLWANPIFRVIPALRKQQFTTNTMEVTASSKL